jgi:hypothetical protein
MQKKPQDTVVDRSCDEVRRIIHKLLDGGEFTVETFCRKIGVSKNSYYRFMQQSGPWRGEKGDTFPCALQYLQQRERDGVEMAPKAKTASTRAKHAKARSRLGAVLDITLDGELSDRVPVYDTCDTVRRKMNAHLRRPDITTTAFLRHLSGQFHATPTKVRPSNLEKFRAATGPNVGNTNPTFYAAYVYFEKKRIQEKTKKTKQREAMEDIYGQSGGVNVKIPSDKAGGWFGGDIRGLRVITTKYGLSVVPGKSALGGYYGPPGCPSVDSKNRWWPLDKVYIYD